MPVPKLILNISLPMMASMLVMALYNIVDSAFVARYDTKALTAISLAFPIQNLMIAVGIGTSVGVNALLSTRLGKKDFEAVDKAASNGVFLAVCNFIAFFLLGLFILRPYLQSQTNDARVVEYGMQYLQVVVFGSFALFQVVMQDKILQSTGLTKYTMISQSLGAVCNCILDPVFIFGLGPFPSLGMTGAALATVIGQFLSMGISLYCNVKKNHEVQFNWKAFRPDWETIKQIYAVAIPTILLNSVTSITTYVMNLILGTFKLVGMAAVTLYGVYFKINSILFMPVFGLNNGLVPIIAYNYGARKGDRIVQTIKLSVGTAMVIMLVGMIILHVFPAQLLMLFNASEHMLSIGAPALRIISLSFVFAGYCIVLSSIFQAFGKGLISMIISLMRQLVVLLPAAYFLAQTGNVNNVWWAYPLAELMSVALSTIFLIRIYKTIIRKL